MRLELPTRRFYLGRDYSEALANYGAVPLHLALIPDAEYISRALADLDGILLPGSDTDADPAYFGEEPLPTLKKVIREKDETEILVLAEAERRNLPVLAICYGMQMLNVSRGGSLFQDIDRQIENAIKHEQGEPLERDSHLIRFGPGSRLGRIVRENEQKDDIRVNSHHHQSVKQVGTNLVAVAWANDGVIEGIEDSRDDRFVVGVQWHPELSWKTGGASDKIFRSFVERCSADKRVIL